MLAITHRHIGKVDGGYGLYIYTVQEGAASPGTGQTRHFSALNCERIR